ncbi:hypothetical protein J2S55_004576 [Streptosporangium brasiliense]|uniref:Uncharacterized protein n=1 Tax=Streptosporangium brasiliense TaxID=47480 RepID=A0ABT9RA80_9ACTN|nr:hypothetical protein [Streptosporangium brasiliense]
MIEWSEAAGRRGTLVTFDGITRPREFPSSTENRGEES